MKVSYAFIFAYCVHLNGSLDSHTIQFVIYIMLWMFTHTYFWPLTFLYLEYS